MLASILDPRLKKLNFINDTIKGEIISDLHNLYLEEKVESELNEEDFDSTPNVYQRTQTSRIRTTTTSSNFILNALFDDNDDSTVGGIDEVDDYLSLKPLKYDCDPLNWWKDNTKRFPLLSKIARRYLSISATQYRARDFFQSQDYILLHVVIA